MNKNVFIENEIIVNQNFDHTKNLKRKFKYNGTVIKENNAHIDVKQIDNVTLPSAILLRNLTLQLTA